MTTLVVQAHPREDSYNAAVRDRVLAALSAEPQPVVGHRLGLGERPLGAELETATRLVLVYPTWSGGLPALLLDWVHTVLDQPTALDRVADLTAVTTCGSSQLINRIQGEWGRRYLRTTVLDHCRPGARFRWLPLYKIDRRTRSETADHLDHLAERVTSAAASR